MSMNANKNIDAEMALDADKEEEKNLLSYSLQNIREETRPYLPSQLLTHKRSRNTIPVVQTLQIRLYQTNQKPIYSLNLLPIPNNDVHQKQFHSS